MWKLGINSILELAGDLITFKTHSSKGFIIVFNSNENLRCNKI